MKSRKSTTAFLLVFFSATLAAVVFRFDTWPLTWVPMYSDYESGADITLQVWNREELGRGFLVTTQDGRTEYVNYKRLNIPRTKFIRLYYERIYGIPPAKEIKYQLGLSKMNRRLRELVGVYPATVTPWNLRILYALNKSLGREPGRPDFIVTVEASALERRFSIRHLNAGGGVRPPERRSTATAVWKAEWLERWFNDDI
jgi:hypothetical protein